MRVFIIITILTLILTDIIAQNGTIRGSVIENATGETLIGATVMFPGTTTGTITDLDGKFSLNVPAGNYSLKISFISFQDLVIENIEVKPGEVTVVNNIKLKDVDQTLAEIVVTAEAVKTTEVALMSIRKNAQTLMDGISSAKMTLTGDATAVEAVKRVTGVTIEGGKYVYVRGLGDRYSKTMMNNADIPGLDPDRNTIQMDIFPSNLISNMTISKTFTAELPADFTGGLVNIETIDFPERKKLKITLGTSYNPNMNLKSDFINYNGGTTDFLGFDDGTRDLPEGARGQISRPIFNPDTEVYSFVKKFNPTMGVEKKNSLLNTSLSLSTGNQIDIDKENNNRKLGYIFSLSYKNDYEYFDDVFYGDYQKDGDNSNIYDLTYADKRNGQIGEQSTLLGALGGIAYKTQLSKYRITIMHLQKGNSTASHTFKDNNAEAVGQSGYTAISEVLNYNQSSLTNLLFTGKHIMQEQGWEIDWRIAPTYSYSADPDIRQTTFSIYQNDYYFSSGEGGLPTRTWRYLKELNTVAKIDVTKKYKLLGENAKIRFGGAYTLKYRDYEILKYNIKFTQLQYQPDWATPNPNLVLQDENIYPNGLVYIDGGIDGLNPNEYQSNNHTIAFYASNDFILFPNFKTIIGLRIENFVQKHTGRDQLFSQGNPAGLNLNNEKVLKSFDFFPTVNFIWDIAEEQKLRIAYSNTIARPSFKEVSFAQIADPITNIIFNGALYDGYSDWDGNIQETRINNFDIRYELFMESSQIISLSGFAKLFDQPIEIVRIPEAQTNIEIQPRNVGNGMLFGGELEFVKNLSFINPLLNELSLNGNFTYVYSQIDITNSEYEERKKQERDGENVKNYRPMAGQAPWVVNAGLVYLNRELGLDIGAFYNVKGPTLKIVGLGIFPDVYTVPFHSLNFSASKKMGKEHRISLSLKVSNILNNKKEEIFNSYQASNVYALIKKTGSTFSLGFSYKF